MADERTLPELLNDLYDQVTTLLHQEVLLAKTEIYEALARLARGVALVAAGALILYSAVLLVAAASALIVSRFFGIELWLSGLIVATLVTVVGVLFVRAGLSRLRGTPVLPAQTLPITQEVTWPRKHAK
jgi:hypothetical protein